jgi:alkylation response protein AidB-like acyl-CoA dehydrogenase
MNNDVEKILIYSGEWVDDESKNILSIIRQWAEKEILSDRMQYRAHYEEKFIEKRKILGLTIGLQRLMLSQDNGGFGWESSIHAPALASIMFEIGRADASMGVLFAMQFSIFAALNMTTTTNETLYSTLTSLFGRNDLKTAAIILPGAGILGKNTAIFSGRSINAVVETKSDGYVLNGADLRPFGNGAIADIFCVVCADEKGTPSIAFIPAEERGISRKSILLETGLNACKNTDVSFSNVSIPKAFLVSQQGIVESLYIWLNLLLGGVSLGAAANFLEILDDWANTRVIKGGDRMKENPLCASVVAEAVEEITISRILLMELAHIIVRSEEWGKERNQKVYTLAQMIGSRIQKSTLHATNRGMELMASAGYSKEWHAEKHWRDIKTIQSYLCGVGADIPVKMDIARYFFDSK